MFPKFGITGGIACGKSTVCEILSERGWHIIDTDAVTHSLYRSGAEGTKIIVDAFGTKVLNHDQSVNRVLLGQIVFSDSSQRELLNKLIHPLVRAEWQRQHQELSLQQPNLPLAVTVPLLFEAETESWFESVVCVACSRLEQEKRLLKRGLNSHQIQQRLSAQWPMAKKMERSNITIWNDGSREILAAQTARLDQLWRPLFSLTSPAS